VVMVALKHQYNVSPIHLHALSCGGGGFYEGPRVRRPPIKWFAVAEHFSNTSLNDH
jgi:hypothetical protein